MSDYETAMEPEWDAPIGLEVTPRAIIECVFWNADAVHTGYESCIESETRDRGIQSPTTTTATTTVATSNRSTWKTRPPEETTWHDWTVELKLGEVFVVAHWRVLVGGSPTLTGTGASGSRRRRSPIASVLVSKRVRKYTVVDTSSFGPRPPRTHH